MDSEPDRHFSERLIYPSETSIQTRKCDDQDSQQPSLMECVSNGNSNRSRNAGLRQSQYPHRKYRTDLSGCCSTGGWSDSDPVHPRNRGPCVLDLRGNREHDRRTYAQRLQVDTGGKDRGKWFNGNRSKHVGFYKPINADRQHRVDLSRSCSTRCGCNPNLVYTGDCRTGVLDLRCGSEHDRRLNAQRLQVTKKNKPAESVLTGGFIPHILVFALLLFALVTPLVSATQISFSPVGLDPDNLQVYNSTGQLVGIYNTSSQNVFFDNDTAYSILVVPANDNLLGNHPDMWFSTFIDKVQSNAPAFIMMLFLVVVFAIGLSRRR